MAGISAERTTDAVRMHFPMVVCFVIGAMSAVVVFARLVLSWAVDFS